MDLICKPSTLNGCVSIPGSKSHTIRAVAIAALAEGESRIECPLESEDTRSAFAAFRALGAEISEEPAVWRVKGIGGVPQTPQNVIDVGNSGTTMRIALGACSLLRKGLAVLTGDHQIRRRPNAPLIGALNDLGAKVVSTRGDGCAPIVVEGVLRGGETSLEAVSSQFVTALLIGAPLATGTSRIRVPLLNERPYVAMTLDWLERQGITLEHAGLEYFKVPGGQCYRPVTGRIPADFSSATFFLAAGALPGNEVTCSGLDMHDTQGDRAVIAYLQQMGARIEVAEKGIQVSADELKGCELDLNDTPDALPMMAALACFAHGETRLVNVPQARIKETDRIAVMCRELSKMGAHITELSDGLIIQQSDLVGTDVEGHGDHRVVMALAIAASQSQGTTCIHGYEAAAVTYPTFVEALAGIGAQVQLM